MLPTAESPSSAAGPAPASPCIEGSYADAFGSLNYRLYLSYAPRPGAPLFVMLHGASQNASDFAAGTRMHEVVDECGGAVLFPEQSRSAHPLACWNWYDTRHQGAEAGEPAMLAGLTRRIIDEHAIDRSRVYVAGMSAGGAMAAILGQAYPDLYAAVGIHSGLATGVANDLQSALSAMSSGPPAMAGPSVRRPDTGRGARPTIVFHGDQDRTVHPLNAEAVLSQTLGGAPVAEIRVPGSRESTLLRHVGRRGLPDAEMWIVHGGGHAWAGGSAKGSYTDEAGPDASREMRRFFLTQTLDVGRARRRD
jgi:poly(hydroxyalkanoate) depolymerase family esterase